MLYLDILLLFFKNTVDGVYSRLSCLKPIVEFSVLLVIVPLGLCFSIDMLLEDRVLDIFSLYGSIMVAGERSHIPC